MNISNLLKYFRPISGARMLFNNRSLPHWIVFLFVGIAIIVTFIFAYILRFSFNLALDFGLIMKQSLLVLGIYLGFEVIIKSFTGLRYHRTIKDIFRIIIATTSSIVVLFLISLISRQFGSYYILKIPLSILVIHYISVNILLITFRIMIKYKE
jgi:hypothetical protein